MEKKKTVPNQELDRIKFEIGQEMGIVSKKSLKPKKNINKS
ncbi:MAG: hypothetical protein PHC92_02945 [Syntrophomonadaceae bacterium]|nr:hypothetical protein [Syntrophomonadaceae bacterium]MDD3024072.1 hypothetical protein [Syntrophomonadaceae bacterium]